MIGEMEKAHEERKKWLGILMKEAENTSDAYSSKLKEVEECYEKIKKKVKNEYELVIQKELEVKLIICLMICVCWYD